jgi:hypothetical protein
MKEPKLMVSCLNTDVLYSAFISEGIDSKQIRLVYSLWKVTRSDGIEYSIDSVNLCDIFEEGKIKIVYQDTTEYWSTTPYESPILINPIWYAILKCAHDGIMVTRDYHHIYLEAIRFVKKEDDVLIYRLSFGS